MTTKSNPYERIVLNIPHASIEGITGSSWQLTPAFLDEIRRWTDWYTDWLNKRIYMDETTLRLSSKAEDVRMLIQELYNNLLKF